MEVLILVLVEDDLGVYKQIKEELEAQGVLILVLVEDDLGEPNVFGYSLSKCLNPCFGGRWSRRSRCRHYHRATLPAVLILVLVEDGLGE